MGKKPEEERHSLPEPALSIIEICKRIAPGESLVIPLDRTNPIIGIYLNTADSGLPTPPSSKNGETPPSSLILTQKGIPIGAFFKDENNTLYRYSEGNWKPMENYMALGLKPTELQSVPRNLIKILRRLSHIIINFANYIATFNMAKPEQAEQAEQAEEPEHVEQPEQPEQRWTEINIKNTLHPSFSSWGRLQRLKNFDSLFDKPSVRITTLSLRDTLPVAIQRYSLSTHIIFPSGERETMEILIYWGENVPIAKITIDTTGTKTYINESVSLAEQNGDILPYIFHQASFDAVIALRTAAQLIRSREEQPSND